MRFARWRHGSQRIRRATWSFGADRPAIRFHPTRRGGPGKATDRRVIPGQSPSSNQTTWVRRTMPVAMLPAQLWFAVECELTFLFPGITLTRGAHWQPGPTAVFYARRSGSLFKAKSCDESIKVSFLGCESNVAFSPREFRTFSAVIEQRCDDKFRSTCVLPQLNPSQLYLKWELYETLT